MKELLRENKRIIIITIIICVLFQIKLPYYIDTPGGTININNRIEYKDKQEYNGSLNMLYVTEYVANPPMYLLSYLIKDWDRELIKESQVSNETIEEINDRNKIMLENSINTAKYIAYKEAEKKIEIKEKKTIVIGTTIDNGFKIGDEILELDNKEVIDTNMIKESIAIHEVGDKLNFKIKRNKKIIDKEIEIKKMDNNKVLGVLMITNYTYETDPEIEIKFKASESGSSGGLMMTLSIYCAIKGEDLLKGRNIAGTGTIEEDGTVGEISGIKYKIIGAYKNNMDIVLVPSGNYKEAKKVAEERNYKMKIVEIKTFKDAVEYLKNTN